MKGGETVIYRFMFRGYADGDCMLRQQPEYRNAALFSHGKQLFLYYESDREDAPPEGIADIGLKAYPDGRKWERMMDIFHYAKPLNEEQWKRRHSQRKPCLSIAYLRPEMVASYVYYHYQFQEEYPRKMNNKFSMIFLLENQIVMYGEDPGDADKDFYPGVLTTSQHPKKGWSELMNPHFLSWPDFQGFFLPVKTEQYHLSD